MLKMPEGGYYYYLYAAAASDGYLCRHSGDMVHWDGRPLFDCGQAAIDANVPEDDDGTLYL